jgi:hypothetical protein
MYFFTHLKWNITNLNIHKKFNKYVLLIKFYQFLLDANNEWNTSNNFILKLKKINFYSLLFYYKEKRSNTKFTSINHYLINFS